MRKGTDDSSPIGDDNEEIYPETCCMVLPVTLGTTILSALGIVSCTLSFTSGVMMLKGHTYMPVLASHYTHHQLEVFAYSVISLSVLLFLISTMAIQGVLSRRPFMVLPFFVVLAFSSVLSFVVLMDKGHRWAWSHHNDLYVNRHFFGALILLLLKLYFTNSVYQCYVYLKKLVAQRELRSGGVEAPRSTNAYVILPKYEDLASIQPPAYNM